MIAYTSQLMHVVAVALCDNPVLERSAFFSAGSLRDCTRVANINEVMWSELFLMNRTALLRQMDRFSEAFSRLRQALSDEDRETMREMMRISTQRRALFDKK